MDDNLFAVLDRMIEAGGQKLAKTVLAGKLPKKTADALLSDLDKQGYVRKDGKQFTLTDEGRHAWEGRAGEDRKRELAGRVVAKFLVAVGQQKGKALTAKQRQSFDTDLINRARADELIIETGANKYLLSPKGEEFLRSREPLEDQLKRLRTAAQDLLQAPQALLQRLARDTEKLSEGEPIRSAFTAARTALQEDVTRVRAEFERSLDGLQAYAGLVAAAQTFQTALPGAVSKALQRIDAEAERVRKLESELRQTADQIREELEQARQQMEQRAAAAEEKARAERKPASAVEAMPAPGTTVTESPVDGAVWQATRRTYEHLEQQFKLTAELIKVPNLTDGVRAAVPGLTAAHFQDLLQRWQREDRLVLQVCNDPHFEPRAAEGISSPRGLLFYVEMK